LSSLNKCVLSRTRGVGIPDTLKEGKREDGKRGQKMDLIMMKLSEVIPYDNNPRHNAAAVDAVKASIQEVGYISPIIVDEDGVILAGHTRFLALQSLGMEEIPVGVMKGLNEDQKKKYRLLDNKTNEFAQWDFDKLREESKDLDFSYDFGIDQLLEKGENLEAAKAQDEEPESMNTICTCPRCGAEWEE